MDHLENTVPRHRLYAGFFFVFKAGASDILAEGLFV
jgi:hypothetical protein